LQASKCHVQDFFTIKGTLSKQYRLMNLYVSLSLLSRRLILPSACFCTLKRPMDFSDFFSILQDFHCRSDHPKIALFFFFFFYGEGSLAYMLPTPIPTVTCVFLLILLWWYPFKETGIHVGCTKHFQRLGLMMLYNLNFYSKVHIFIGITLSFKFSFPLGQILIWVENSLPLLEYYIGYFSP
jgi:hypothetical protein